MYRRLQGCDPPVSDDPTVMAIFDAHGELAKERADLKKADLDIEAGAVRIARQTELVDRMLRAGVSVAEAEALLGTLRDTLASWETHRDEIVKRIAYLEAKVAQQGGN